MTDTDVVEKKKEKVKLKKPGKWNVIMHNDDKTPMDFVVQVLIEIFHHTPEKAYELMIEIHNSESAIVGTYYKEIAEEKSNMTMQIARNVGLPLTTTIEQE